MPFKITEERLQAASQEIFLKHHEMDETATNILDLEDIYEILLKHFSVNTKREK